MAVIGEMHYLTIGNNTYSIPVSGGGGGTVTSVRVQATSPVQSSSSSEQTVSLNTTISLADAYGDTKNPYGTKTANYVLAGPTSGSSRVPSFRQLVAADIPDLSANYLPASTTIPTKTSDLTNDSGFVTTDEKLKAPETDTADTYYPTFGTHTGVAETKFHNLGLKYILASQYSELIVGYPMASGHRTGKITLASSNNYRGSIIANTTGHVTATLPTTSGTLAITSDIPTATSDLTNDSNFSVDASYVHTDNNYTTTEKNKLSGIASGAEVNVQANWNETSSSSDAYIQNKPTIPTATSDLTNDSNFITDASYVHTDNNYTSTEKTKLSGIAEGAEVNQNAFSTVKIGSTSLAADSKTDTLTITAGNNITLTPTASSDSFTIAATDTTYSDVVAGGASGLMTGADKTKLNGIASGAEVNVQANWNETSSSSDAYIQNKPTINKSTVSSTAPSGGTAGDLWFKIVT